MSEVVENQPNSGTVNNGYNMTNVVTCQPQSIPVEDSSKSNVGKTVDAELSTDFHHAIQKPITGQSHSGADAYNCSQWICICYQPVPTDDCDCCCTCDCCCCCDNCDASCCGDCGGCDCTGLDCSGCDCSF